jgi:medium-chain acyl-[acyl-carrier-protein] hydrolase
MMRFFIPALRADLRLAENYQRSAGPPLGCPIAAFVGRRDLMTDLPGVLAWHAETVSTFDLTVLDAGHFMLEHPDFVAAARARLYRLDPTHVALGAAS